MYQQLTCTLNELKVNSKKVKMIDTLEMEAVQAYTKSQREFKYNKDQNGKSNSASINNISL